MYTIRIILKVILITAFLSCRSAYATGEIPFSPCPKSPNCVSSHAPADDPRHYIAPLTLTPRGDSPLEQVHQLLQKKSRVKLMTRSAHYLHYEFTSRIFGFVDDVEFYAPAQSTTVHMKSASRVGYSDLGANRNRLESIRGQLQAQKP
ncbi:MAG: DUF1499 domain-containing protein [Zetaproteobacteria bacterium]|nr:DUF1499 domain-containing protein [Zetaproteobacteria bacterium]